MTIFKRALFILLTLASFSLLFWLYWQYQNQQDINRVNHKLDMLAGKVELSSGKTPAPATLEESANIPKQSKQNLIKVPVTETAMFKRLALKQASPITLTDTEKAALEEQANAKQQQINQLIIELDKHLNNTAKKAEIQQKINGLLKEYNQLILPVALTQMAQNNEPKTPAS